MAKVFHGRLRRVLSCLTAVVLTAAPGAAAAEPPEEVRARFLNEYRQPAADLRAAYSSFEITYRQFSIVNGSKKYSQPVRGVVAPTGWKLMRVNPKKPAATGDVMARNKDYEFNAAKEGGGFVLSSMNSSEGGDRSLFLCPYVDVGIGRPYVDIASDPAFTPVSLTDAVWRGTPCKAFRITVATQNPKTGVSVTFDKAYYFDHNGNWVCLGWRSLYKNNAGYTEDRYTYRRVEDFPVPALAHASRWVFDLNDPAKTGCRFGLDVDEFNGRAAPAPESEFRLTSLGISEPVNPRKAGPWWNGYLLAAAILLAFSVAVWYARKRAQKVAAP